MEEATTGNGSRHVSWQLAKANKGEEVRVRFPPLQMFQPMPNVSARPSVPDREQRPKETGKTSFHGAIAP